MLLTALAALLADRPRRVAAEPPGGAAALLEAERALREGRVDDALLLFERASLSGHAARAETGLVRAHLQQGQYRRALALAAHVAGEHADFPEGVGLYAWLLWIGGQTTLAERVLARAQERAPGESILVHTAALLRSHGESMPAALLEEPARYAPFSPESAALPPGARVIGTGVVSGAGRLLAALAVAPDAGRLWARDGRGRVCRVRAAGGPQRFGLMQLERLDPVDVEPESLATPPRAAFPGSPALVAGYATNPAPAPAWPLLRAGFLRMPSAPARPYPLEGEAADKRLSGGPVFDVAGRWIGVAVGSDAGLAVVLVPSLRAQGLLAADAVPAAGTSVAIDAVYERALTGTVQIIGTQA